MSNRTLFGTLIDSIFGSPRMKRRYMDLMDDPRERRTTEYFGKRSLRGSAGCIILAVLGLACAAGFLFSVMSYHFDATVLLVAVGVITLALGAILFELYPYVYLIRVFRYAKYQRTLNDLPIGKRAKSMAVVTVFVSLILLVITAYLLIHGFLTYVFA